MILFIRKIPANTKLNEIVAFVEPAVKGGLFRKGGVIKGAKILALRDMRLNTVEFHGLVNVEPDKEAQRVLKKLKGKRFKGKFVVIRQYYQRDWHNDKRHNRQDVADAGMMEQRITDRRRGKDLEIIEDLNYLKVGDFSRKNL